MQLLKTLTAIHGTSGEEGNVKAFIIEWVAQHAHKWKVQPEIIQDGIQDCLILVFGQPRTAVYAHLDTVGFTVAYNNQLEKIGSPDTTGNWELVGEDAKGPIEGVLMEDENHCRVQFNRTIDRGTSLSFKPHFTETQYFIESPYLDNRLGVYVALELCETLENGAIVFSSYEEHGGGSVGFLTKLLYENYSIQQALIADITWVTDGIPAGNGVAISLRDMGIPRKSFVERVQQLAREANVPHQLEVEGAGGSDGTAIQRSPYPIDWCFVGAPEMHAHSPMEKVHKTDIQSMITLYRYLLQHL